MPLDKKRSLKGSPDHSTENGVGEHQNMDKSGHVAQDAKAPETEQPEQRPKEHGGQSGLEPTRYGDWEKKGRCTDF